MHKCVIYHSEYFAAPNSMDEPYDISYCKLQNKKKEKKFRVKAPKQVTEPEISNSKPKFLDFFREPDQ